MYVLQMQVAALALQVGALTENHEALRSQVTVLQQSAADCSQSNVSHNNAPPFAALTSDTDTFDDDCRDISERCDPAAAK